jgi:mono/diheme cytochrome c family protein
MKRTLVAVVALGIAAGAGLSAQDAAPDPKKVEEGKKLYALHKCNNCHMIDGKGAKKGPLDGVGSKLSAAEIRHWMTKPAELEVKLEKPPTGTNRMSHALRNKKFTEAEIDAFVAYMQSLKKK